MLDGLGLGLDSCSMTQNEFYIVYFYVLFDKILLHDILSLACALHLWWDTMGQRGTPKCGDTHYTAHRLIHCSWMAELRVRAQNRGSSSTNSSKRNENKTLKMDAKQLSKTTYQNLAIIL